MPISPTSFNITLTFSPASPSPQLLHHEQCIVFFSSQTLSTPVSFSFCLSFQTSRSPQNLNTLFISCWRVNSCLQGSGAKKGRLHAVGYILVFGMVLMASLSWSWPKSKPPGFLSRGGHVPPSVGEGGWPLQQDGLRKRGPTGPNSSSNSCGPVLFISALLCHS